MVVRFAFIMRLTPPPVGLARNEKGCSVRRPFRTILLGMGVMAPVLLNAQTPDEFRQDFDTAWRAASGVAR